MKKHLLLLAMILLPLVASADDSGSCGKNVSYYYTEATHTLRISGNGPMKEYSYTVTEGSNTYRMSRNTPWNNYREEIETIEIADGVTSVGASAFTWCKGLKNITLPEGLTFIGYASFQTCENLESITLPESVDSLDAYAFYNCKNLKTCTLGNNIFYIGPDAFYNCNSLTSIHIPKSVEIICQSAFEGCSALNSVLIDDISSWCGIEFVKTEGYNDKYTSNPLGLAKRLYLNGEEIKDLIIPEGVTSISNSAFQYCSSFNSIKIPSTISTIGEYAFVNVESSLYISDLKSWCNIKFGNVNANPIIYAKEIYVNNQLVSEIAIPEGVTSIEDNAFRSTETIKNVKFPSSLTTIGEYAFAGAGLTSLVIPDNVKVIKESAFSGCLSLTNIKLGEGLSKISNKTFYECLYLDSISFSDNIVEIGDYSISVKSDRNVSFIRLGKGLKKIGSNVFSFPIVDFYCYAENVPEVQSDTFWPYYTKYTTLHVPSNSIDLYKNANYWKGFGTIVTITSKYKLIYIVDGAEYKSYDVEYGATITPEAAPTKEGYTFSGWSEIPETMPAHDVTVTGTFSVNKYKLTYKVDGEEYKSYDIEYGATITPEAAPTKEGYTFSGWSEIPATMPAHDVTITGTFAINKYKLTYKVDGKEYKSYDVEFGATITPETALQPSSCGYFPRAFLSIEMTISKFGLVEIV